MADLTPNIPEVVAEVREHFERYEKALVEKNVEVLLVSEIFGDGETGQANAQTRSGRFGHLAVD